MLAVSSLQDLNVEAKAAIIIATTTRQRLVPPARGNREEKPLDKNPEAGDYISIAQASTEFGLNKSMIRTALKRKQVRSMQHPWGIRVLRGDVAKLKMELARIEHERTGR
jgi:hypothetical protein